MKIWLTPKEAKVNVKDKWDIPSFIMIQQYDTIFKDLKGMDIKVGEPFMCSVECINFKYTILHLRNAKYNFIYVLEGFEDWVLNTFDLKPKYRQERF